jgi:hypothetical protein
MALYLLQRPQTFGSSIVNGKTAMVVEADSTATAKRLATAQDGSDSPWDNATVTAISAGVASDYVGFRYNVKVSGDPAASTWQPDLFDQWVTGVAADTVDSIGEKLANQLRGAAVAAAIADDGGVFTDETTEANQDTANDMTLFPAVPAAGDAYCIGAAKKFSRVLFNVGTAGVGTYTVTWEYWNGTAWAALSGVTDDTGAFKTAGVNDVVFTIPDAWTAHTINSQGPFYYIRAKIDAGTTTTVPVGTRAWTGAGLRASYDTGTNILTVAAVADGIGDHSISLEAYLPNADAPLSDLVGTVTDGGSAAAALTVVLEDETAIPAILAQL